MNDRSLACRRRGRLVIVAACLLFVLLLHLAAPAAHAGRGRRVRSPLPKVLWTRSLPHEPWGVATDAAGVVATTDLGEVVAVGTDGRPQWSTQLDDIRYGNPAIDDRSVVVATRADAVALDRADGRRRWVYTPGAEVRVVGMAAGVAFVADESGLLAAIDLVTGAPRWTVRHAGTVSVPPEADADRGIVLATWHFGPSPAARALDLRNGALRWATAIGRYAAAPVLVGEVVVVPEGDGAFHAQVRAVDVLTGAPRWATAVPGSFESGIQPGVAASEVVVVDHFGVVSSLDAGSGRLRWQADLGLPVLETRVVITAGSVAVVTASRHLVVLDRATGRVRARGLPGGQAGVPFAVAALGLPQPRGVVLALRRTDPPRIEARGLP